MSLRNKWVFTFTAQELLAAAEAKVLHHVDRKAYWDTERDRAMAVVQDSVEIQTNGFVDVDKRCASYVQTCSNKIQSHAARMANYGRWARAFTTSKPDVEFNLDADDIAFFGL